MLGVTLLAEPQSRILAAGYMPNHAVAFWQFFCSLTGPGRPALAAIGGHVQDHPRHSAGGSRGADRFDHASKILFHTAAHGVVT